MSKGGDGASTLDGLNLYALMNEVLPRYCRMHPRISPINGCETYEKATTLNSSVSSLREAIQISFATTSGGPWFAIPGGSDFASSSTVEGGVFPMDIASCLPVMILEHFIRQSNGSNRDNTVGRSPLRVLDLCCSPGAKLQLLSDILEELSEVGTIDSGSIVVGVDISPDRLRVCKSLISKWSQFAFSINRDPDASSSSSGTRSDNHVRQLLFQCDGTKFTLSSGQFGDLIHDSGIWHNELLSRYGLFRHKSHPEEGDSAESEHNCDVSKSEVECNSDSKKHEKAKTVTQQIQKRSNKSSRKREATQLKQVQQQLCGQPVLARDGFDYVLVDAECSHSGSYRHMTFVSAGENSHKDEEEDDATTKPDHLATCNTQEDLEGKSTSNKRMKTTVGTESSSFQKPTARSKFLDPARRDTLQTLQRGLIQNGFSQLRPGGVLVYSTCSEECQENEEVLQWLLETEATAELVECPVTLVEYFPPVEGTIPLHTLTHLVSDISSVSHFMADTDVDKVPILLASLTNPHFWRALLESTETSPALSSDELKCHLKPHLKSLSEQVCAYMGSLSKFPVTKGSLSGTVKTGNGVGMSGLFVGIIRKKK